MLSVALRRGPVLVALTTLPDGVFVDASAAFERALGYRRDELIGRRTVDLGIWVNPDDRARALEDLATSGIIPEREHSIRARDGGVLTCRFSAEALDVDGRHCALWILVDITDRKRAEQELRRRNRELVLLNRIMDATSADLAPAAILEVVCRELALAFDLPQSTAALLNEERTEAVVAAEYAAPGRPSVLGARVAVTPGPLAQALLVRKEALVADDAMSEPGLEPIRDLLIRRDAVSVLALPLVVEGQAAGALLMSATERRTFTSEEVGLSWTVANQAAAALARARLGETRRRLITAIEQTPESIVITDTSGRILYVNPAFERISGYTAAEALGQNPRILKSGRHDAAFYGELWTRVAAGQVWHGRVTNRKKDGSLFTEDAVIAPVRDDAGTVTNYIAVKRDITYELAVEEQHRQTQKMETIGRLAGGVAHDFNNLLMAIGGHAELALGSIPEGHPARPDLEGIQDAALRGGNLTRQMLAFARRQVIEPKVLNLNDVIAGLSRMLQRLIGENIELGLRPASDLGLTRVDGGQLEQVLLNLVINARDAMPAGGRLTIRTWNAEFGGVESQPPAALEPGRYVAVSVADTGVGMSDEARAHLFEPFFTTKEQGRGTGLGLATCFGIVQQSRGHILCESQTGQGTTFTVFLPRVEAATATAGQPASHGDVPRGHESIVLAEDEGPVRRLLARILRGQGYAVLEAGSADEALSRVLRSGTNVDLLVTDVVMPGMSGQELAARLRVKWPALKILYISGHAAGRILETTRENAAVRLLQKPFTAAELAAKVREALDAGRD